VAGSIRHSVQCSQGRLKTAPQSSIIRHDSGEILKPKMDAKARILKVVKFWIDPVRVMGGTVGIFACAT
jgi:hypothetical protein